MRKKFVLAALILLAPWTAWCADFPVKFGEIRDGNVVTTDTIKMCTKKTGYTYGFEILLPKDGKHEVSGDLHWPPLPGVVCSSCAHVTNSYGTQSGRFVKSLTFDPEDQVGDYSLIVIVDHAFVATVKFKVIPATSCP